MLLAAVCAWTLALGGARTAQGLEVRGRLIPAQGSPSAFSGWVVWIEKGPRLPVSAAPRRHAMRQVNKKFSPPILAIAAGDLVDFENLDKVFHNVFSLDKRDPFDMGLFKGKKHFAADGMTEIKGIVSTVRTFPAAGKYPIFCNIHPDMEGVLHVFDHSSFAQADSDGLFNVPAAGEGPAVLLADGPGLNEPARAEIVISAAMPRMKISMERPRRAAKTAHTRKDGEDYPRERPAY